MFIKNIYLWACEIFVTDSSPETLEAHKIKASFFTYPTLTEICRRLVTQYFLLTEEELTMWEEDPEGFSKNLCIIFFNTPCNCFPEYLEIMYK